MQNGFREVSGQLQIEDAEGHALLGSCTDARAEVAAGLALTRDNFSLERGSRTLFLCGQHAEATAMLRELRERYPNATLTQRVSIPLAEATEALNRNQPRRALDLLERVKPYDRASRGGFWPEYLRGTALLQLRDGTAAAAEFQSVLNHRGEDPSSTVYPLARLGLARAQALAGDSANARQSYAAFFDAWPTADQTIGPVVQARQELARLK